MGMWKKVCGVMAAAVLSTGVASGAVIDDFSTTSQSVQVTGLGSDSAGASASGAIGGYRQMDLQVTTSGLGLTSQSVVIPGAGLLSFSNDNQNVSVLTLTYDNNTAGLGGVDLTDSGLSTHFQATLNSDVPGLVLSVDITDTDGDTASFAGAFGTYAFVNQAFASFLNAGNVNFASVNKIIIELTGPASIDAEVVLLETTGTPEVVPTPAALPAGLALLAGVAMRRRRR